MRRKDFSILALVLLAAGLAACGPRDPGIIKYPSALSNLKEAPRETAKDSKQAAAQTHTQLALAYMNQGDLKDAEEALRKAIGYDDRYTQAHTLLAILNWQINRMDAADKEFRAAIAIDSANGDANNNYGRFLCAQGKRRAAMKHFKRALADPFYQTPVVANANAGECLLHDHDFKGAAPYLKKALELDPQYGTALMAMAQLDFQQGDAFAARGYLQRFETAGRATPDSLLLGFRIASQLGDKDSATSYFNRLQDQYPNSEQAQLLNGSRP